MPPSSEQVSGILAIQIHQMADLEIKRRSVRRGAADTHTPSTYAQIVSNDSRLCCSRYADAPTLQYVNDEQLYVTRLKRMSSSPYINAKTEVFCRDWTRTRVDVVIMDYRERGDAFSCVLLAGVILILASLGLEEDAVVGVIAMRLADLLSSSSQATGT